MVFSHPSVRLITVLFLAAICGPASACSSALLLIPTTDVLPTGHCSIEVQGDSATPVRYKTAKEYLNTELGLSRNVEAGVDFDIGNDGGNKAIGNFKYRFEAGKTTKLPIAVGVQGIDSRLKSTPYACTSLETRIVRLTAGALRSDDTTQWFTGLDRAVSDKLTLMADYISGHEFFASAGFSYELTDQFSVLSYAEFPNADGGDTVYSVHFVMCQNVW